jgi:hypothetical protein
MMSRSSPLRACWKSKSAIERLSDIEGGFGCTACGRRGADVRPNFHWEKEAREAAVPVSV